MNQIMEVPASLVSPLSSQLSSYTDISRSRAELRGTAGGFDHAATSGSFRFQANVDTLTTTIPGTTTTQTVTTPTRDAVYAQGGTLKQILSNEQKKEGLTASQAPTDANFLSQSLNFQVKAGGQTATISLSFSDLYANKPLDEASIYGRAASSINQQLQAQGMGSMSVEVSQDGGGNALVLHSDPGTGLAVEGSQDTLNKLGFVNSTGQVGHNEAVSQDGSNLLVNGVTESTTSTQQVTTPGSTSTSYFLQGGSFSLNGLTFNLQRQQLDLNGSESPDQIQQEANQAAVTQLQAQFANQAGANGAAGFQQLNGPTLNGGQIEFDTTYQGSQASLSFSGSDVTGTATNGTDPSIDAGSLVINGVSINYGAKSFQITTPGENMTALNQQKSDYLRDAINAASGQTNVVAGVDLDNSLNLVSTQTGSRSHITIGTSDAAVTGFSSGEKAASLSNAIVSLQGQGVSELPSVYGSGGGELSADQLLNEISTYVSQNALSALQSQSTSASGTSALLN